MTEKTAAEVNYNDVKLWLRRAQANSTRCFICLRIAQANDPSESTIKPVKMAGLELTPEVQISHLARCVGKDAAGA